MRALALVSGGLDSSLAMKLILNQGVEVIGLNFTSPFCMCNGEKGCGEPLKELRRWLGAPILQRPTREDFYLMLEHPRFGYGRQVNPCIDCRLFRLQEAKAVMAEVGASFLITGEVVGQRPKSQQLPTLGLIERESGLEGLLLRPLSAQLLPPTIPEERGWVDREQLLDIRGRSRYRQIALAAEWGLSSYPQPAGGCLLTEEGFANRVRDLWRHGEHLSPRAIPLLRVGRHFRLSPRAKGVVGRNEKENQSLRSLAAAGDLLLEVEEVMGPTGLCRGAGDEESLRLLARLVVRYADVPLGTPATVIVRDHSGEARATLEVIGLPPEEIAGYRL